VGQLLLPLLLLLRRRLRGELTDAPDVLGHDGHCAQAHPDRLAMRDTLLGGVAR
jgi:hypothetical protein